MQCLPFIYTNISSLYAGQNQSVFPSRPSGQAGNVRWAVLLVVFILCAGALAFLFREQFLPATSENITEQTSSHAAPSRPAHDIPPPKAARTQITTGWVTVQDRWGDQISKTRAAVIDGIWIALPVRACLGGETWVFTADNGEKSRIEGGFWVKGDDVGLWHLAGVANGRFDIPAIPSWEPAKDLQWVPLAVNGQPLKVTVTPEKKLHFFTQCSLSDSAAEPGLFMQDPKVVGWSFGGVLPGGYLWNVPDMRVLENAWIWVDDFYAVTFANGREEYFAKALATKNKPYSEQLQILVEGLRIEPKLAKEDTPSHLRSDAILENIRFLIAKLLETGTYKDYADIFYDPFLIGLADTIRMTDAIWMTVTSYGHEKAIKLTEQALAGRQNSEEEQAAFISLQRQLYLEWLGVLRDDGDTKTGWRVFSSAKQYYPYDPEIHLIGVELALAENDWQEAEKLLFLMQYPPELNYKVTTLETIIAQLKGQAGKIVIHFTPGNNVIPVKTLINGRIEQQFVIDTGASMVTIPTATAEFLGLEVDEQTQTHQIFTAGGVKTAPVVTLSSIEIEGLVVRDVKAFVLDIPSQHHLGLLGLNFLSRFRMDIDTDNGVLLLEPR